MLNPLDLSDRAIMVTGASSGIGRETSILLSQLGARVVLVARNLDHLNETLSLLEPKDHIVLPFDLSRTAAIPEWLRGSVSEIGPLSGLVHCAGVHLVRPLRMLRSEDYSMLMRVNVEAAIALVKGFRQRGVHVEGMSNVVLMSSVVGVVGEVGVAAYSASKGAIISLTKSLAMELAKENIRVNCIAPGQVATELTDRQRLLLTPEQFSHIEQMHPLGIGTSLDVAYACAYLLADTARWITGTTLIVDGGYTAH